MPGPVIQGHAEYETECESCHVPFSRGLQRDLCLDCHEEIASDLTSTMGFHGLSDTVRETECAVCHTDHEGRDADVLGLDPDNFDHDVTDFPLLGSHGEVICEDCHASDELFHAASTECFSCHVEEDQHMGNLGESCSDCHSETAWTDAVFDHDTTDFLLTGSHVGVTCADCHVNEQYVDTPNQCVDCHLEDDNHMGTNGEDCQSCHATTEWSEVLFDHFVTTGFGLTGSHGVLMCESCHEGNKFEQTMEPDCYSCHEVDDSHEGINGTECASCHQPTEWLDVSFDHAQDAGFALNGTHGELLCGDCHEVQADVALPASTCIGCHEADEVHAGQLGERCESCHNESGWLENVRFDHDFSRFPLLGLHADVVCEDCHESQAFLDAPEQCVDCHVADDVHNAQLGQDCGLCHNPNDWLIWRFDHTTQTEFTLDGAHAGLDCLACHQTPVIDAIALSMTCGACHRSDDVHSEEFGLDCAECHTTNSFEELRELQ